MDPETLVQPIKKHARSAIAFMFFSCLCLHAATVAAQEDLALSAGFAPYRLVNTHINNATGHYFPALRNFEATTALAPRLELRLLIDAALSEVALQRLRQGDALGNAMAQATYRYTWYAGKDWQWKLGLSTGLDESTARSLALERARLGATPLMHLSGSARLWNNFYWSVNVEGARTRHASVVDLGMRLSYSLSPGLDIFGGYRWSDSASDTDENTAAINRADLGLRLRF